ncbi:hypothetical protein JYK14_14575 [Siccirubricoccus sp. KC 17139]|uniref:PI3K/PI4K catalytic domain-containing protein n=1 Tax=Siccirubricoccus soli TaxID=2899147 RepID=A0ABT1D622_9PROT|nr:hypothetical protein [Siccirubricoccus soli]MCO6417381.1 hypothetical protein [Siccirubricoccus soli]MCP2683516.1 hypothetical protein [Siccirubricoccus soli]
MSESRTQRRKRGKALVSPLERDWSRVVLELIDRSPIVVEDEAELPPPPPPAPPRPPALVQAVQARMLTFEELTAKIGHTPHWNQLFGKYKRSTDYKAMRAEITKVETTAAKGLGTLGDRDFDAMATALDELIAAAKRYKAAHAGKENKVGAGEDVLASAEAEKLALAAVRADPAFDRVKDHITLKQAIECKRRGIAFADCRFDLYNDDKATAVDDNFGAGMANSVAKITYEDGSELVFKGEKISDTQQLGIASAIGIDGGAPHNGNRNIATSAIAEFLGKPEVVPKVCYGLHSNPLTGQQEIGLLMTKGAGKTVNYKDEIGNNKRRAFWEPGHPPSDDAIAKLGEQLTSLDWSDVICGQQDRHGGNLMIEIEGDEVKVTGIDNDVCFGKNQLDPNGSKSKISSARTNPPGMPPLIDKKVYDRLVAGDFDRDLAPTLSGLLTPEELAAAKSRFDLSKQHALGLNPDYVVADWKAWRSPAPDLLTAAAYLVAAGNGFQQNVHGGWEPSESSGGLFARDFGQALRRDGKA